MCKNKQLRSKERSLGCRKYQIINFYTLTDFEKVRLNFVFCERELYDGTAPEQKTKSAKNSLDSMSKLFFNPSECNKLHPPSHLSVRSVLLHFVQRSPPETRTLCKGGKKRFAYFIRRALATLSTV